jgi:CRISPR system Cascade subunit CasB
MSEKYRHFPDEHTKMGPDNTHHLLREWFKSLYDNKGERAGLRRCTSPDQVFMTPGFQRLARHFGELYKDKGKDQLYGVLACAAGVIAHVKNDIAAPDKTFAKQMAMNKPDSDKPVVSQLRFNQLQKSYSWDEFYRRLIRSVKLIGGDVNIVSLTDAIFHWGKEFDGQFEQKPMNRLQVRWAADYYHIANIK